MLYSRAVGGPNEHRTVPEICYLVKAEDPLSQHAATNRRAFVKSLSNVYSSTLAFPRIPPVIFARIIARIIVSDIIKIRASLLLLFSAK